MNRCMLTFAEDSSSSCSSDEDVAGPRQPLAEGQRAYCECGKLLRRVAKLPDYAVLLRCARSSECCRCDETILAGELHFRCSNCEDTVVCKECGPGVQISTNMDSFDACSGEIDIKDIPEKALHVRKARVAMRTRGVVIDLTPKHMEFAGRVVENARKICQDIVQRGHDIMDGDWHDPEILPKLLGTYKPAELFECAMHLAEGARVVVSGQAIMTEVQAPCKVYGDLHGQLRDLLILFASFGFPATCECPKVIFNGDFVDRGRHQVEVALLLFALKISYPDNVFLNRGNHEEQNMNTKYGFHKACLEPFRSDELPDKAGQQVFQAISQAFTWLPLASLINKKILVVHGGIGDGKWTLEDLKKVERPLGFKELQSEEHPFLWNILWSDPIEDDSASSGSKVFGVHNSPRGKLACKFGWNVTQQFCATNGLDLVVRSHQAKKGGFGFDVMHNESLIRVFSARDYEGHANDCAILSITDCEEGDKEESGVLKVRPQVLSSITNRDD